MFANNRSKPLQSYFKLLFTTKQKKKLCHEYIRALTHLNIQLQS